jgi:hypothetical protein
MVLMVSDAQSRADCCESFVVALYNICIGRYGGLESALRAMAEMGIDFGILVETEITEGINTQFLSGYNVFASNAVSVQQGGIALFWKPTNSMRSRNGGRADQTLSPPLWCCWEASVITPWNVTSHRLI